MDEAEQLSDRLVVMDHGTIVAQGSPSALIAEHVTREVLEVRFPAGTPVNLQDLGLRLEKLTDRTLVYTDDGEATMATLVNSGRTPTSSLVRRASLEDVFLALTGRRLVE
jgi:lipooligosaccharide transport system ATP-binding protein